MGLDKKIEIKNKVIAKQSAEIETLKKEIEELKSQRKFDEVYNSESLEEAKKLIEINVDLKKEYEMMISTLKNTKAKYEELIKTVEKDNTAYKKAMKKLFSKIRKMRLE